MPCLDQHQAPLANSISDGKRYGVGGGQQDGAPPSESISEMGGAKAGWEQAAGSVSPRSQPRVCLNPEMANGQLFL